MSAPAVAVRERPVAPTDAAWDRAMRDEIERLPRWGLVSRGGEPYELDHTKNGDFLSRADVLRILRDRERGALALAEAEAERDRLRAVLCDIRNTRLPIPVAEAIARIASRERVGPCAASDRAMRLEAVLQNIRPALAFYADPKTYDLDEEILTTPLRGADDFGSRARSALVVLNATLAESATDDADRRATGTVDVEAA